jgi:Domain of unknown function (DUF4351)
LPSEDFVAVCLLNAAKAALAQSSGNRDIIEIGDLPESMTDRLSQLSLTQLEALGTQILSFTQLADVTAWLEQ